MATLCDLGISAGEWIVNHTLVPYPVQSTVVLAAWLAAIIIIAVVDMRRLYKSVR